MFIDTSAVVAVVIREANFEQIEIKIEKTLGAVTSPMVRLEASIVISDRLDMPMSSAEGLFNKFLARGKIQMIPISDEIGKLAVEAYQNFGKGRHPARLNLADCFSYAVAKHLKVPILFVGSDFSKTDLKSAL
jgi:ribonuclease VapC